MNGRERFLTVILVLVVGGGGTLLGVWYWFLTPMWRHNAAILSLQLEVSKKQEEIDTFQMERRKLVLARAKSLPPTAFEANNEYQRYLQYVLINNGLTIDDVSPSTQASKMKFQPTIPGIKEVGHQVMTYTVRAKGELRHLVAAMEQMQSTPYEHRIKNMSVDRHDLVRDSKDPSPKLHISMTIETLLVAKSNAKTGLPPGFEAKYVILDSLAGHAGVVNGWGMLGSLVAVKASMPTPSAYRYYDQITKRNPFTGPTPKIETISLPPVVKKPREKDPEPVVKDPEPIGPHTPRYVYLTHTDPEQQTAFWRNRVFRTLEQKLIAKPNSGYQHFVIKDEPQEFTFVKAKVIRVDLRVVYFQQGKTLYGWHIGTSLEEALGNEIDIDARDRLDLQIDQEYFKESTKDEKSKTKKTPTKGPTKGSRTGQ